MISANKIALGYCEFGFYGYFCGATTTYRHCKRACQRIIESIGSSIIVRSYILDICGCRKLGLYRTAFLFNSSKCDNQMKPTIPSARVIFRASRKKAFSHVPGVASVERTLIKKGGLTNE